MQTLGAIKALVAERLDRREIAKRNIAIFTFIVISERRWVGRASEQTNGNEPSVSVKILYDVVFCLGSCLFLCVDVFQ